MIETDGSSINNTNEVGRTTNEILSEVVGAKQVQESEVALPKSNMGMLSRITDKEGNVNLSLLSIEEIKECLELGKRLNVQDICSVMSYGSDIQKSMNDSSKSLLSSANKSKLGDETSEILNNLLAEVGKIDIDDLKKPNAIVSVLMKIPGIKNLFMTYEKYKANVDGIEKNVEKIENKIEQSKLIAKRDNSALEEQFRGIIQYIGVLEKLIVAAKMKSEELARGIMVMESEPQNFSPIQISDANSFKHEVDKKVTNMLTWRTTYQQSLFLIRQIQEANIASINNAQDIMDNTMPMLRNQLAQSVTLYNLEQNVKVQTSVKNSLNDSLKKNASRTHDLITRVTELTEGTTVSIETIRERQEKLVKTLNDKMKIWQTHQSKRSELEAEIGKIQGQLEDIVSTTSKMVLVSS